MHKEIIRVLIKPLFNNYRKPYSIIRLLDAFFQIIVTFSQHVVTLVSKNYNNTLFAGKLSTYIHRNPNFTYL